MSDLAVRVEQLGKRYRIGHVEERYPTLRESLARSFRRRRPAGDDTLWALRDVTFEVAHGEVLGIIGRNGAGKSTLLRILSRITPPTEGWAEIRGRVGSLLEVGIGFHPELTGRENIYLNGAILGMRRAEIAHKFDEIAAFAEVERFLDTPVKHYSSGMYVRLAFSVAAHLEPEILIVDEVLSVGDVAFQRKCLGKMNDVARAGRTVLFVSHSMGVVQQLCPTCLLLDAGRAVMLGPSAKVIEAYLDSAAPAAGSVALNSIARRGGDGRLRFTGVSLRNGSGQATSTPASGQCAEFVLDVETREELKFVQFWLTIFNHNGAAVAHCDVDAFGRRFAVPAGRSRIECRLPRLPLAYGRYTVTFAAADDHGELDHVAHGFAFEVEAGNFYPVPYTPPPEAGVATLVEHSWKIESGKS